MFRKYSSIENSYQDGFLDKIVYGGFGSEEYIVQEKIHGGNFSVIVSPNGIEFAARNGVLGEDGFKIGSIQDELTEQATKLYALVDDSNGKTGDPFTINIYGELYGGQYDHPDVDNVNVAGIQKGKLQYRPDLGFMVFDILVQVRNESVYLNQNLAKYLAETCGFDYAETLFTGTR